MLSLFKKPDPLLVKRLLPVGVTEFEDWSDRIIALTGLTATPDSQKFTLAAMITTLPKTESAIEDLYFVKALHKGAADQIAGAMMEKIRNSVKARLAAEEEAKKQVSESAKPQSEVTPTKGVTDVLGQSKV